MINWNEFCNIDLQILKILENLLDKTQKEVYNIRHQN